MKQRTANAQPIRLDPETHRPGDSALLAPRLLLACGCLLPILLAVFVAWAAAVTPDYSHASNTVSQLAAQGQPHPAIMGVGFIVFGTVAVGFAAGVGTALLGEGVGPPAFMTAVGLAVYGAGIAASGFVQDYPIDGSETGTEGFLHSFFAQIAVGGLLVAVVDLFRTAVVRGWRRYAWFTIFAAGAIALSGMAFMLSAESMQGIMQRMLYAVTLAWLIVTALFLAQRVSSARAEDQGEGRSWA